MAAISRIRSSSLSFLTGSGTRQRNLGNYERARVALHDLHFHNNVTIAGTYTPSDGHRSLGKDNLYPALCKVIERHPALTVTVKGKNAAHPYFETLQEVDLDKVVDWREGPHRADRIRVLEETLSRENSVGFSDETAPLWRIVVLEPPANTEDELLPDVIFVYHHVIADGKSGLAFHASLLESLNEVSHAPNGGGSVPKKCKIKPASLLPSMDTIFGWADQTSPWFFQKWLPGGPQAQSHVQEVSKKWAGAPYNYRHPIVTGDKVALFDKNTVQRIVRRCDAENTTVNPFFQALAGAILLHVFPAADSLVDANAMCIRRFIPAKFGIDDRDIGLFISSWHETYTRSQLVPAERQHDASLVPMPWDQARKSRQRIEEELAKGSKDLETEAVKGTVASFTQQYQQMEGKERANSYSITNLGAFRAPSSKGGSDAWKLGGLVFSQSEHATGSAMQFDIVTLLGGEMAITINWQRGIVQEEDMERIRSILKSRVEEIASEPIPSAAGN